VGKVIGQLQEIEVFSNDNRASLSQGPSSSRQRTGSTLSKTPPSTSSARVEASAPAAHPLLSSSQASHVSTCSAGLNHPAWTISTNIAYSDLRRSPMHREDPVTAERRRQSSADSSQAGSLFGRATLPERRLTSDSIGPTPTDFVVGIPKVYLTFSATSLNGAHCGDRC